MARRPDGSLVAGRDVPGRGAWLCRDLVTGEIDAACLDAAASRDAFNRAFRKPVSRGSEGPLRAMAAERENMESAARQGGKETRRD